MEISRNVSRLDSANNRDVRKTRWPLAGGLPEDRQTSSSDEEPSTLEEERLRHAFAGCVNSVEPWFLW